MKQQFKIALESEPLIRIIALQVGHGEKRANKRKIIKERENRKGEREREKERKKEKKKEKKTIFKRCSRTKRYRSCTSNDKWWEKRKSYSFKKIKPRRKSKLMKQVKLNLCIQNKILECFFMEF